MAVSKQASENKRKTGPGRPEGRSDSREQILDAAERHFAEHGYAASSLREIATDANVTQAMVNYYFGSKRKMFKEVYVRRGYWLAAQRMELLERTTSKQRFSVEDIVRSYISPPFQLRSTVQGRAFLRLQARLHSESDEESFALRRQIYDRPVRAYVASLQALLPEKSKETLYLRFAQLIGIYLYILSDAHRVEQISGIKHLQLSADTFIDEIVMFAAAGFRR
ncbi:AcrR family transcriptional regulator [Bradyrhizobium diazoefficiens]|uniref:TetR/AcrR family transcriptional regulator n=1 Tax=Bradyrhizobium TaxID=374 RepID=UPI000D73C991|nr:TetR/AcrR family transcriptional regulator [Bradyrhizobium diazoefficiens]AWO93256.1 TetR/AcrR family transcriptional regulator [Bradyrhizobium diazoefficiens]